MRQSIFINVIFPHPPRAVNTSIDTSFFSSSIFNSFKDTSNPTIKSGVQELHIAINTPFIPAEFFSRKDHSPFSNSLSQSSILILVYESERTYRALYKFVCIMISDRDLFSPLLTSFSPFFHFSIRSHVLDSFWYMNLKEPTLSKFVSMMVSDISTLAYELLALISFFDQVTCFLL